MGKLTPKSFRPIFNYIVIYRERPKTTKGGIHLPSTYASEAQAHKWPEGRIIAMGETAFRNIDDPDALPTAKVGDRVLLRAQGGEWFKIPDSEDEIYIDIDTNVLCVIEDA